MVTRFDLKLRFAAVFFEVLWILLWFGAATAKFQRQHLQWESPERGNSENIVSHSCIHDQIIEQRRLPGRKLYSVTPQFYEHSTVSNHVHRKGRSLLGIPEVLGHPKEIKQPIRIYLNYDAVGLSQDRDCRKVGDIVKLGEPPVSSSPGTPSCNPQGDPPIYGDCWYNCTLNDLSGEDKRHRLQ